MRAVVMRDAGLVVDEVPVPALQPGQVLAEVLACGICGSDLHALAHADRMVEMSELTSEPGGIAPRIMDPNHDVVMGHEFSARVLEVGDNVGNCTPGDVVVSLPIVMDAGGIHAVGYSNDYPGGYAEQLVLSDMLTMKVPNGLHPELAALTEPMAVAWHAVRRSEIARKDVAIVIGCGPVGLAVICLLKARGVKSVVASDFSPGRRALAQRCGADVVIDPATTSPWSNWQEYGFMGGLGDLLELGLGTREKLAKLPLPWWQVWRLVEALGQSPARPVIFECVGVPGLLQQLIDGAPLLSRVVVAGVCMQVDRIEPALAVHKEIDLRFVFGHSPLEFRDTLHMIADGKVDCAPLITGVVGLDGVADAFAALRDPEQHAKILIDPKIRGRSAHAPHE